MAGFVLNDALFVLTGLNLHRIIIKLRPGSWPVLVLRHAKHIDDIVLRQIQALLDTEEIQLANVIDQNT